MRKSLISTPVSKKDPTDSCLQQKLWLVFFSSIYVIITSVIVLDFVLIDRINPAELIDKVDPCEITD